MHHATSPFELHSAITARTAGLCKRTGASVCACAVSRTRSVRSSSGRESSSRVARVCAKHAAPRHSLSSRRANLMSAPRSLSLFSASRRQLRIREHIAVRTWLFFWGAGLPISEREHMTDHAATCYRRLLAIYMYSNEI